MRTLAHQGLKSKPKEIHLNKKIKPRQTGSPKKKDNKTPKGLGSNIKTAKESVYLKRINTYYVFWKTQKKNYQKTQKTKPQLPVGHLQKSICILGASLVVQLVKNLPEMQETPVQFLGWKDPLWKGQATHSSIHGLSWWLRW